jgi:hypothetical protein
MVEGGKGLSIPAAASDRPDEAPLIELSSIPITRESMVDGEVKTHIETADVVINEMDSRIDGLKSLIKCVSQ